MIVFRLQYRAMLRLRTAIAFAHLSSYDDNQTCHHHDQQHVGPAGLRSELAHAVSL